MSDAEFVDRLVGRVKGGDIGYVLVVSSREEQTRLLSLARRGAESADTITALRAENEKLRAALRWIDEQRYTDRDTITPDNAFEKIGKLNGKIIAIMDRARAAITQETRDERDDRRAV